MKIPTPEQIKEADQYTVIHEPVSSIRLMERAAARAFDRMLDELALVDSIGHPSAGSVSFSVFCGPGNNGGDGLVIARHLAKAGFNVFIFIVREKSSDGSPDFLTSLEKLKEENVQLSELNSINDFPEIPAGHFIIDAVFGIGLNRPPEGIFLETIRLINSFPNKVIAIDMPSGLMAEGSSSGKSAEIIKAYLTLTFQFPKLSFFLYENEKYTGKWIVIDIGISSTFINEMDCSRIFLTASFIAHQLKKRKRFSHKGDFGHALLVAGSRGKGGAAVLAAKSVLCSGAGLLTVHLPSRLELMMQTAFPEAIVSLDREADFVSSLPDIGSYDVAGIGPGIGPEKDTANLLKKLIQDATFPLVLDADALNIIAENKTWLSFLSAGSVITPHPGEFDRLFGRCESGFERLQKQKEASFKFGIYIVLKGAYTSVACPDGTLYFNCTGNPGMATAGTGDVLTGILTGLIARGYSPETACVLGVYLHGRAGDLAIRLSSAESLTAGTLISHLGSAFFELEN